MTKEQEEASKMSGKKEVKDILKLIYNICWSLNYETHSIEELKQAKIECERMLITIENKIGKL